MALGEILEELVTAIGDRSREVVPVLQLESKNRLRVIAAKELQFGHASTVLAGYLPPATAKFRWFPSSVVRAGVVSAITRPRRMT